MKRLSVAVLVVLMVAGITGGLVWRAAHREVSTVDEPELATYLSVGVDSVRELPAAGDERRLEVVVALSGKPEWAGSMTPDCVPLEDGDGNRYRAESATRAGEAWPVKVAFVFGAPRDATGLRLRWTCWSRSGGDLKYTPLD